MIERYSRPSSINVKALERLSVGHSVTMGIISKVALGKKVDFDQLATQLASMIESRARIPFTIMTVLVDTGLIGPFGMASCPLSEWYGPNLFEASN